MADPNPLSDAEREELIAYLDGELDPNATQALEKKLKTDPRLRAEAEALRRTWNLLDFLPQVEPSPHFTQRTVSNIVPVWKKDGRPPALWGRHWLSRLGWVAALLLTGLVGYGTAALLAGQRSAAWEAAEMEQMARDLHLLEHLGTYQYASDIQFLNELDRPELFGED